MRYGFIFIFIFSLNSALACESGFSCKQMSFQIDLLGSYVSMEDADNYSCEQKSNCELTSDFASTQTVDNCAGEVKFKKIDGEEYSFKSKSRRLNTFITNRFVIGATQVLENSYKIRQKKSINDIYGCVPNDLSQYHIVELKNLIKPKQCYPAKVGYTNDAMLRSSVCDKQVLVTDLLDKSSTCAQNRQAALERYNQNVRAEFNNKILHVLDPQNMQISSNYDSDSEFINGLIENLSISNAQVMAEFALLAQLANKHNSLYRQTRVECRD